MNTQKFHKEVGFEENALEEIQAILEDMNKLKYTKHAQLETVKVRQSYFYENQLIPVLVLDMIKLDDIFEYTREDGKISKIALRITNLSDKYDFSYFVSMDSAVITCWINIKEDSHKTLDRSLYENKTS